MLRKTMVQCRRRGAVAPLVGILMIALLGMVAFAVDLGYIILARSEAQHAADAAALAAVGKISDQLRGATLTDGAPAQTQAHLDAARAEAQLFAGYHRVGGQAADVKDAEVEFGYLADPFNSSDTLQSGGWPARPYNAARVTVRRDKDHVGGPLTLFFARVLGMTQTNVSATATAVVVMGSVQVQGSSGSRHGGLLPFTFQVDEWHALLRTQSAGSLSVPGRDSITITDSYKVDPTKSGTASVSSATDGHFETKMFPDRTTSGNFGTINFTRNKSSNSTDVLRDLIVDGPNPSDWSDLSTILQATPDAPVSVNGDPGLSSGMEDAVKSVIGQPRVLPLYRSFTTERGGGGNNTFYAIVEFVPITIVAVDLKGGTKSITIQPRVVSLKEALGSDRINFEITPSGSPNPLFLGSRSLVR